MQSLIRKKKTYITESLIKESLLRQLSYSVKEVQLQFSQTNEIFTTNEACNSLIVVLEAIFLHGMKKGILRNALKTVGGVDESRPQPSFWAMVSNYTHKNIISIIKNLSQINTDVGRCRVWLRIALNQTEITSYFQAMEKERRPIISCYNNYAFLRDRETCDTASKLLQGIDAVQFDIPINASILNSWNTEPLMMSGIWSPPLKIPLSSATDVVEGLEIDNDDDDSCSIKTSSSITTLSTILAMDENQALKIILETPLKLEKEVTCPAGCAAVAIHHKDDIIVEEEEEKNASTSMFNMGNSLNNAPGWSSGDLQESNVAVQEIKENQDSKDETAIKDKEPKTYSSFLEIFGSSPKEEKNYKNILQKISEKSISVESEENSEYEVVNKQGNQYEEQLFKIVLEKGLKAQNYTCLNCQLSIGLNFDEARFCYFTGHYYCNKCHLNESSIIPSRLLYNWDHKKYPVCQNANSYLSGISQVFLIDIKRVNHKLYSVVPEMQELRRLRLKLNLLRAYLCTCREPVIKDLQKRVWPRDYLYENIHSYTLSDLCKVPGGALMLELKTLISFSKDHVLNCWLCSQKGFICEICRNPKVIYPFDSDGTFRCGKCCSVYHGDCLHSRKNCPKCERLKRRSISRDDAQGESD